MEKSYVDVVQGKARVAFFTTTLAGEDVPLEIQIEGGNKIYKSYIDILPDLPIKIDLSLSKDKIEASRESKTILEAVLKDRYNNEVFTNNTLVLNSEVHERSRSVITFDAAQKTVVRGKAQFQISASDIPGRAYFKISSNPDLAQNSFDLIGQAPFKKERLTLAGFTKADGTLSETGKLFYKEFSGSVLGNTNSSEYFISKFSSQQALTSSDAYKGLVEARQTTLLDFWKQTNSLEVSGVGQNAGSVETFFFWDKEDIDGSAYNSMYTVLAGAPYGDISQENYLASALLFDKNNSSLAVSSLLSAPFAFHDVLQIAKNGSVSKLQGGDITQDLQFRPDFDAQGRLTLDVYNQAL